MPAAPARLHLEPVEARLAPAATSAWLRIIGAGAIDGPVVVLPAETPGWVRVIGTDGSDVAELAAFPDGFGGPFHAAVGDVTGDGTPDLLIAAGTGGGPRVRVFDGKTLAPVADFLAFEPDFRGGVYVAAADLNQDGAADVIVGAGEGGGPRLRVFDGRTGAVVADWFAFEPDFRGGVRVAAADVDHDGLPEVVAGAGPGGGPRVGVYRVILIPPPGGLAFDPAPPIEAASFLAFEPAFRGGVSVAAIGGSTADGLADKVVAAPGPGGGPVAVVFDGTTGVLLRSFLVGDPAARPGVELTGQPAGLYVATPTPAGTQLDHYSIVGQHDWTLPPGERLLRALVTAVDPAAGTVTARVPDPGEGLVLTPSTAGPVLPPGTDRTVAVAPAAAVTREGAAARLADVRPLDEVELYLGADGRAVAVRARPAGFRGPVVE